MYKWELGTSSLAQALCIIILNSKKNIYFIFNAFNI